MVDAAVLGTMAVGGLLVVAVFVALTQARTTPFATGGTGPAAEGYAAERWQRRLGTTSGRVLAFLAGGLLVTAAASSQGWGFPVSEIGFAGLSAAVAFLAGGFLAVAVALLVTAEDEAARLSVAFLLLLLGIGAVSVLAVASPDPGTNVWLLLGALAAAIGTLYGVFSMGRSIGEGNAGGTFLVAATLFVLVLIAITVRIAFGG